jgi:Flp pilus assembly pilin Flp
MDILGALREYRHLPSCGVVPMLGIFRSLIINDDGVTAIEYAFVASLISIAVASGVATVGTSVSTMFAKVAAGF